LVPKALLGDGEVDEGDFVESVRRIVRVGVFSDQVQIEPTVIFNHVVAHLHCLEVVLLFYVFGQNVVEHRI